MDVTFLPSEYAAKGVVVGHPETVTAIKAEVDRLKAELSRVIAERDEQAARVSWLEGLAIVSEFLQMKTERDELRKENKVINDQLSLAYNGTVAAETERDTWKAHYHNKTIRFNAVQLRAKHDRDAAKVDMARQAGEVDLWKRRHDVNCANLAQTGYDQTKTAEAIIKKLMDELVARDSTLSLIRSAVGSEDVVGAVERLVAERDRLRNDVDDVWELRTVLMNENAAMVRTLEQLARLGNGDKWGNSEGNIIAQNTLLASKGDTPKTVIGAFLDAYETASKGDTGRGE